MQVSAQPQSHVAAARHRSPVSGSVASIDAAVERSAGRGGHPAGSDSEEQHTGRDPRTEKTGHKTVFLARSLSSTLTELQMAASAADDAGRTDRADATSGSAASGTATLDELLSSFLSAA